MRIIKYLLLCVLLIQSLFAAGCGGKSADADTPEFVDAQEFKLKVRELADQMLATTDNSLLTGLVAMPSSFVDLNNKDQTSSLGNLLGESLIYEFNQRGFPVREYRLTGNINTMLGQGDFALLRQGLTSTYGKWAAVIVGTYHYDKEAVFVNARLVRASDGMVLRTGQLVLVNSALMTRLSKTLTPRPVPTPPKTEAQIIAEKPRLNLSTGTMHIQPAPYTAPPPAPKGAGLYGVQ